MKEVLFDRLKSNLEQCINNGTIYFLTDSNGNFTQIALGDGSKSHIVGIGPKMDDTIKKELMSKLGLTISSDMGTIQLGKLANHNDVSSQKVVTYERIGIGTNINEISTVGYVQQYMQTAQAMVYAGLFNAQTKEITDYNTAIISPSEEGNVTLDYLLEGYEGETFLTSGMSFIVGTAGNLEGYQGISIHGNVTNVEVGDMIVITNITKKESEQGGTYYNEASILIIQNKSLDITEFESGIIYDVSAHNDGAVFESLSALLSASNLSTLIPTSVRRGGMTIRFIQSSNNKYVQYRLMNQNWSTIVTDWQGVDDEPTTGSDNLVKSGGVVDAIGNYVKQQNIEKNGTIDVFSSFSAKAGQTLVFRVVSDGAVWIRLALFSGEWETATFKQDYIVGGQWYESVLSNDIDGISLYPITMSTYGNVIVQIIKSGTLAFDAYKAIKYPLTADKIPSSIISNDKIANNAVTEDKTSFIQSKNLVNLEDTDYAPSKYLNDNGNLGDNSNYNTTGFIPVIAGQSYIVSTNTTINTFRFVLFFDKNKQAMTDSYQNTYQNSGTIIVAPTNSVYLRITFNAGHTNYQVEKGTVVTPYSIYQRLLPIDIIPLIGTTKIENEAITTDKLKLASVTEDRTSFFEIKNIFDDSTGSEEISDDNVLKHYLYENRFSSNDSYFVTKYIPVQSGQQFLAEQYDKVTFDKSSYYYVKWICYYNVNKEYISTYTASSSETIFTACENAAYMRITAFMSSLLMVSYDIENDKYAEYGFKLKTKYLPEITDYPEQVLPSRVYCLDEEENSVYFKNVFKYINPNFLIKASGWNTFERYARRDSGMSSWDLSVSIYQQKNLTLLETKTMIGCKGSKATDNGTKAVNVIGDSFTYNGAWFAQINALCPSLSFVGMRTSYNSGGLKAEGRGGWTLADYFKVNKSSTAYYDGFSPFMHPSDKRYYGIVEFWKDIVNSTIGEHTYPMEGFGDYSTMFSTDGYKLNPSVGDVMYDFANSVYKEWNGASWSVSSLTDEDFEFNYSTYIDVWNINSPDFVLIMLGVNDWFSEFDDSAATLWNSRMQTMIQSIRSFATRQSRTIVIGLCTNTTIAAAANNSYNINPDFCSRNLFKGRKNTIVTFDTDVYRTAGVYVVDTGACLDPIYGLQLSKIKPFIYYEEDDRELYSANGVHPSTAGYKQLGTCAAGFIQYIRGLNL